jgi:RNA polymerase sigma-70 factor, ECF subfamily
VSPLFFKRLSDEILGSRLASGEAAAFDELYRRYSNRLAAYGAHLLGDSGLGDDVAQATMLKAYGALREGRVPERMKPWLFRIAHNVAIDIVVRRRELPSDNLPESPSIDREPFAGTLVEALATLPDRQRRVYILREVHGLRIDETAAELGLNATQVEQALFAARNRLAEQLVFGDRLNCVTVQRLAGGPLDASERRALKTHLRTCTACRQSLGLRGRALSLFPAGMSLEWLARLGPGLLAGGAPAAAKVGAVVATATIAAGVPVAVEKTVAHHAHRPVATAAVADVTPVVSVRARTPAASSAVAEPVAVAVVSPLRSTVAAHGDLHRKSASPARHGSAGAAAHHGDSGERSHGDRASRSGDSGEKSSGRDGSGDHASPTTTTTTTSSDNSGDGGSSKDSSSKDSPSKDGSSKDSSSKDSSSQDGGSSSGDRHSGDRSATTRTSGDRHRGDSHGDRPTTTTTTTTTTTPPAPAETDSSGGEVEGSQGGGDAHPRDGSDDIPQPTVTLPVPTPDLSVLDTTAP